MSRREALGLLLLAMLVAVGRVLRRRLLGGADGRWREPGWLEQYLPPPIADVLPARTGPRRPTAPLDPNTCPPDSLELLPEEGEGRLLMLFTDGENLQGDVETATAALADAGVGFVGYELNGGAGDGGARGD